MRRVLFALTTAALAALPACGLILSTDGYAGPPLVEAGVDGSSNGGPGTTKDATSPSTDGANAQGECGICPEIPNASSICNGTTCVMGACKAGYDSCDGLNANGCETPLTNNDSACGACNITCGTVPNGQSKCSGLACAITSCTPGFANCDPSAANGCETAITTATNCGACNVACANPHGGADCSTGTCTVSTCDPGFGNCDAIANNGCETPTTTSAGACSACGMPCAAGKICVGSACVLPSGTATCAGGCACTGATDCTKTCDGANCAFSCGNNATCTFNCDVGGGCTVTTGNNSHVIMSCKAGGCSVTPATLGTTVDLTCAGGNCTVTNASTATVHCAGGGCKVTCAKGGTCTLDQCAPGYCEDDCPDGGKCTLLGCTKNCGTVCGGGAVCDNSCKDATAGCVF